MRIILFLLITLTLLTSCNEKKLQIVKNDVRTLSAKELTRMGQYTVLEVLSNDVYHQSDDADKDPNGKCTYDFYRPKELRGKKLPLVIFLHEGGFVFGDRTDFVPTKMCKDLARAGFAVANMNYHLINNPRALISKEATHRYIMEAVAEVRLGIQNLKQQADDLVIDTNKIYVMGWSAGGAIANALLFTDREEALNYVASEHRNDFKHNDAFDVPLHLAGVIAIGGCLMADDADDTDLENTKCLLVHGTEDDMIPSGYDYPLKRYGKGINADLPVVTPTIKVGGQTISLGFNLHTPDWMSELVMNAFTTKVYGSRAIWDLVENPNVTMLEVKGGSHDFFLTDASFNENYKSIFKVIQRFIK